jgi:glycopeptide antibiotics resistance protein
LPAFFTLIHGPDGQGAQVDIGWALLPLVVVLPAIAVRGFGQGADRRRIVLNLVTASYVVAVLAVALFPMPLAPYDSGLTLRIYDDRGWPYPWISPIPFDTIRTGLGVGFELQRARYLVGNLIVLAPLGALLPLLQPSWSWRQLLFVSLSVAVGIETAQLAVSLLIGVPYRVADIDDVLVNLCGAILGFVGFNVVRRVGGRLVGIPLPIREVPRQGR